MRLGAARIAASLFSIRLSRERKRLHYWGREIMKTAVVVAALAAVLFAAQYASLADAYGPRVIIVGAGMSGN